MRILGVSDLPVPAAAVVVDGAVLALVSGDQLAEPLAGDDPLPWPVIDEALRLARLTREEVDVIGVAGRLAAPWAVRRSRRLGALARVLPVREAQAAWQVALRATGLGAWTADVMAERLSERFEGAGFSRARVAMVDAHQALAEAGYRGQDADEALVVALQPLGDGTALSVHRGQAGLVDRLEAQAGAPGMHAHLDRVRAALALGPDELHALDALAGQGGVDEALLALLRRALRAEGPRLGGEARALGADPLSDRLAQIPREDAAATAVAHLGELAAAVVRRQARAAGLRRVVFMGELAELPRVVARVAEDGEVDALVVPAGPGRESLALGAALGLSGYGPRAVPDHLGPRVHPGAVERLLHAEGWGGGAPSDLAEVLARGEAVVRWCGRAGVGPTGLGQRAVLVRADRPDAVARLRGALGIGPEVGGLALRIPRPCGEAVGPCLRAGTAAPRVSAAAVAGLRAPDGRVRVLEVEGVDEDGLGALLRDAAALGVEALAAFPLRRADGTPVHTVEQAAHRFRDAGLAALQLDGHAIARVGGTA